ncbi:MAG: hypothetical protein O3A46_14985 [Candidatus Poribacteria bacterium]|nr:hypothetical protein [Candidatus Poribacteria bacterium]
MDRRRWVLLIDVWSLVCVPVLITHALVVVPKFDVSVEAAEKIILTPQRRETLPTPRRAPSDFNPAHRATTTQSVPRFDVAPEPTPIPTEASPQPMIPTVFAASPGPTLFVDRGFRAERTVRLDDDFPMRVSSPRNGLYEPKTAVEYLLTDASLSDEQRRRVGFAARRWQQRQREHLDSLKSRLVELEAIVRGDLDEDTARRVLIQFEANRRQERRLLRHALMELRSVVTLKQWERFSNWAESRPWVPFHHANDSSDE